MTYGIESTPMINVERVYLNLENPRHEPFDNQDTVIEYLCHDEQVLPLAKDIADYGLNPLEHFALIPDGEETYIAVEGNRRLCAIMLLIDPDLAPPEQRKDFEEIAKSWTPILQISAKVFKDRNEVRLWLDRIHAGSAQGRGRRQWNAEQKTRNSGYTKNTLAQKVLDAAQDLGFITVDQRKGRLSTVQRYLSNPFMRNALGLDNSYLEDITTNLPADDFGIILNKFIKDVSERSISTRDNSSTIQNYSNSLGNLQDVSGIRVVVRYPILSPTTSAQPSPDITPTNPKKPSKITHSKDLNNALKEIPNYKLEKLYYSLCKLPLNNHTPLLSIGVWSFIETLTALDGRKSKSDFYSYLDPNKLKSFGLDQSGDQKSVRKAVQRFSDFGNSTKHHKTSAAFNSEQLANDMETINEMLVALASNCKGKT